MKFVGFDPGGKNSFGWAVVRLAASGLELVDTGTCSSAPDAVRLAEEACGGAPAAFATDAPMFWAASGDRISDTVVRRLVCSAGGKSGTVNHINSLRGACLVQGIQVTRFASLQWPTAKATEAHPKALVFIDRGAREFLDRIESSVRNEHERDAAIAAYAAAAFANRSIGWVDLALGEEDPFFPSGSVVAYWFPREPLN